MEYLEQSRATLEDGGSSQPKYMVCFTEKDNEKPAKLDGTILSLYRSLMFQGWATIRMWLQMLQFTLRALLESEGIHSSFLW